MFPIFPSIDTSPQSATCVGGRRTCRHRGRPGVAHRHTLNGASIAGAIYMAVELEGMASICHGGAVPRIKPCWDPHLINVKAHCRVGRRISTSQRYYPRQWHSPRDSWCSLAPMRAPRTAEIQQSSRNNYPSLWFWRGFRFPNSALHEP